MVKKRKSISLITSTVMAASIFNFSTFIPVQAASDAVFTSDRISGADRFETAAKIADKGWTTTSDYAVIATGEDYPDALCASPLAKKYNAPIILTETNKLSDSAQKELKRLSVKNVFIVGGTGVVSTDVENQIKGLGINPTRIAGTNRYKTSFEVAKYLDKNPKAIAVATGNNFADALSFSSIAAMNGDPILLTDKDSIDSDIKQYISDTSSITNSYVIGGTGVVSDSVLNSLKNPIRLSGKNRYETNTAVLNYFKKDLDLSNVYLATGNDFPDALASSVLASKSKTPILLINSGVDSSTISFVNDNTASIKNITAIGGTNAVSDNLLANASENFVNYVISFSDVNLQNAIDEDLNKKDGEPILKKETDKITTLNLSEKNISSLQGIQYLTNLQFLNLSTNLITDLSNLSSLINLKELNLANNYRLCDITALGNLKNLTKLNLSTDYYKIKDLSPLTNLTNLTELDLSVNNQAQNSYCSYITITNTDITPLSNLTNLTKLNLNNNIIKDITGLDNLKNLTELDLADTTITDITPLSNLTNLTKLDLNSNDISDLTYLGNLTELKELYLANNKFTNLSVLSKFLNLTKLDLTYNNITDFTPLSNLINLTDLNLESNNILDLTILANLTNLTKLDLSYNYISDLTPLATLTNLTDLNLQGNNIANINPLSNLTNLTKLNLSITNIASLSSLAKLTNLTDLNLLNTKIKNLYYLSGLTNLTKLDLSYDDITDLTPLDTLTNLTELDLIKNYFSINTITDLTPLSKLTKLTKLTLSDYGITDLTPLAKLTNLTELDLSKNKITDLTPLSNLINLTALNLENNNITDLAPLNKLVNLTNIYLPSNEINNLDKLKLILPHCTFHI